MVKCNRNESSIIDYRLSIPALRIKVFELEEKSVGSADFVAGRQAKILFHQTKLRQQAEVRKIPLLIKQKSQTVIRFTTLFAFLFCLNSIGLVFVENSDPLHRWFLHCWWPQGGNDKQYKISARLSWPMQKHSLCHFRLR